MLIKEILHNCRRFAESPAYVCREGVLTYRRLEDMASSLAQELLGFTRPNSPVMVYGHKQPLMPVCILACSLAGCPYVPVDDSVPAARAKQMREECGAQLLLAVSPIALEGMRVLDANTLLRLCGCPARESQPHAMEPGDVFYIRFTSGSSGVPKGVKITRDNLECFVAELCKLDGFGKHGEVILNQAAFSFDLSVADFYAAFSSGATLFVLEQEAQRDFPLLFTRLKHSGAQTAVLTPSFAELCLSDRSFGGALLPKLHTVFFCGETLHPETVCRLWERFGNLRVYNAYGPTETTVAVTVQEITPAEAAAKALPVGYAIAGTEVCVVDNALEQCPDGQTGQLLITGKSVGAGYTGAEQGGFILWRGKPAFLTGDLGTRKNGQLYCGGRADRQVKYRGYRLEPQDIEANLLRIGGVARCAVAFTRQRLTAFVQPERGSALTAGEVTRALREYLPPYMVPSHVRLVTQLPLNENGKTDYPALEGELF